MSGLVRLGRVCQEPCNVHLWAMDHKWPLFYGLEIYWCIIIYRRYMMPPLLRVSESNEVPISSRMWVASTSFKQL